MKPQKTICFDLDGTLTLEDLTVEEFKKMNFEDYQNYISNLTPNKKMQRVMENLFAHGDKIMIYTTRQEGFREATEIWLKTHNFIYHQLHMAKPPFDYYIDKNAISLKEILKAYNRMQEYKRKNESRK
jgi:uncharacterized HAD superfamily protein